MASIIIHGLRLFLVILQEVGFVLKMTMHYTHSGTTSLYQVSCFKYVTISELRFFKWKK